MLVRLFINGLFWQDAETQGRSYDVRVLIRTIGIRQYNEYDSIEPLQYGTLRFVFQNWENSDGTRETRGILNDSRVMVSMTTNNIELRPEPLQRQPEQNSRTITSQIMQQQRQRTQDTLQQQVYENIYGSTPLYSGITQRSMGSTSFNSTSFNSALTQRSMGGVISDFSSITNTISEQGKETVIKAEEKKTPIKYLNKFDILDIA